MNRQRMIPKTQRREKKGLKALADSTNVGRGGAQRTARTSKSSGSLRWKSSLSIVHKGVHQGGFQDEGLGQGKSNTHEAGKLLK